MSLLVNMLSRLVIALLSRSKHLLISWLQSPSTVILEPKNSIQLENTSKIQTTEELQENDFIQKRKLFRKYNSI